MSERYPSLGLRASAFQVMSGVYYAIFETTRINDAEVKHCVAFGHYDTIVRWLFAAMARCEAGLIVDAHANPYDPTVYYHRVMTALQTPHRLFDQPLFLDAGSGPEGSIPRDGDACYGEDRMPWAAEKLLAHGFADVVRLLRSDRVAILRLHAHARVVADIFGFDEQGRHIPPWRIIEPRSDYHYAKELAPKPCRGPRPAKVRPPCWIGLDGGSLTALCAPGGDCAVGDRQAVLCEYIARMAPHFELAYMGWGLSAIRAVRQRLAAPPDWPCGSECLLGIDVDAARGMAGYVGSLQAVLAGLREDAAQEGGVTWAPISAYRKRGLTSLLARVGPAVRLRLAAPGASALARAA